MVQSDGADEVRGGRFFLVLFCTIALVNYIDRGASTQSNLVLETKR